MAVFGRRQPHAAIILRGGQFQPPIGRALVAGQKTSQLAAGRYFRRQFPPIVKRAGGAPATARLLIVRAQPAWRPSRQPVYISKAPPAPVAGAAPVATTFIFGQQTAQLAANRFFRRSFAPVIRGAGSAPPVAHTVAVSQAVRAAWDRFYRRQFPPILKKLGSPPPVGAAWIFGADVSQALAGRFFRRSFPPLIKRVTAPLSPPPPPPSPPPPPPRVERGPQPPLVLADVVDDDTERAIVALWLSAGDVTPVDLADDDTLAAVIALWRADMQLPQLFRQPPQTGRLPSTDPGADVMARGPYAVLDCQLDSRKLAFADPKAAAYWNDYRLVTVTIYGTRADVVQAAGAVLAVFNRKLGAPGQKTLKYPSGARFIRWEPVNQVHLEEDKDTKAGRNVWKAVVQAKVWSVRQT